MALGNLAESINQCLRKPEPREPIHNILVATGGLRSTLPCLTVYSLLFGFEMVYLSEESDSLIELRPETTDDVLARAINWNAIGKDPGVGMSTYLRKILDFHNEHGNEYC